MRPSFLLLCALFPLSPLVTLAGEGNTVIPSNLKSVTVYRSGAELIHTATAHLQQGANELVIGEVSNSIDASSIQIGCSSNVTVMSVTFSTDHLRPEIPGPAVQKLLDSIGAVNKELARLEVLSKSANELLDLLNSNKSIGNTTAGVSVAELSKMLDYQRQKQIELRTEISGYAERTQQLKRLALRLDSQVKEDEKKNAAVGGSLVLQLKSPMAGDCHFTISYLTMAAHWEPAYDLKIDNGTDPLQLIYKARIVQTSGIDWKQVKLSLSTSIPTQGGNAPILKTWFLKFVEPAANVSPLSALEGRVAGLQIRGANSMNEVVVTGYGFADKTNGDNLPSDPLYIVNGKEVTTLEYKSIDRRAIKRIDVLKDKDATAIYGARAAAGAILIALKDELGDYVSLNDRQMDAVFDIDIPYDVPGNGMEQGVTLKEYRLPCAYQYFCAPDADKDVYLLGQLTGWEKLNLLPGEASIMVEGTYIGKSRIEANSTLDTLNLTLGRDKRIVVKKEKVTDYSSVKFLGSNKKQVFAWQITVRNNKKEKVHLLLKDQYPISTNKDIEEELLETEGATVNKDTGILTWNVELAPGESRSYRFSYGVKYPKDKVLNIN